MSTTERLADMLEGMSVGDGYYQLTIGRVGAVKLAERIVKNEGDLAAALGLVTREEVHGLRVQLATAKAELSESRKDTRNAEMHSEVLRHERDALRAELDQANANLAGAEAEIKEVRAVRDDWKRMCVAADKELKQANATLARVRELAAKHRDRGGDRDLNIVARLAYQQAAADLDAALTPAAPLPTEPGSVIIFFAGDEDIREWKPARVIVEADR